MIDVDRTASWRDDLRVVRLFALLLVTALAAVTARAQGLLEDDEAAPIPSYYLMDNFSFALPSTPWLTCTADGAEKKVGVASTRVAYTFDAKTSQATIDLPERYHGVKATGTAKLWIKGDGSDNRVTLDFASSDAKVPAVGSINATLNFEDWREFSVDLKPSAARSVVWLSRVGLAIVGGGDKRKGEGQFWLDDLRIVPAAGAAPSIALLELAGENIRPYTTNIYFNLDLRNFGREPFTTDTRVKMVDRNDNLVSERSFEMIVGGGESQEMQLHLAPENLAVFLPPFRFTGGLFSPDNVNIKANIAQTMVMGNSYLLFEDFANVFGRWFVSGLSPDWSEGQLFGEEQHSFATLQTRLRIDRVARTAGTDGKSPPGGYAMKIDFNGSGTVFNGIHRYLPGDAFRMGVWVHGDGSGAELEALVFDYTQAGSTFYNWKRSTDYRRRLCTLDFTGWRYIEVPLPGNGIGPRSFRGSTDAVDFPLDLSGFRITAPAKKPDGEPFAGGSVQIGPIYLQTQQTKTDALAVHVGYDDVNHEYGAAHNAWATIQNAWRPTPRTVTLTWNLFDGSDDIVTRGRETVDLAPMGQKTLKLDLASQAAKIAARQGPFRLHLMATDKRDAGAAEAQLVLSRPDSTVTLSGFEADRSFLRLTGAGVDGSLPAGRTDAAKAKVGKRSLAMQWKKSNKQFVSVDPAAPGTPTAVTMWVHGDNSGALFYPLIGDKRGIISGVQHAEWDLFLPRTDRPPHQNAVVIDWDGWKELTFRLPPIPEGWADTVAVLPFVPSYPLGIHLAIDGSSASKDSGTIYVDELRVHTHLPVDERVTVALNRAGESDLAAPGSPVSVTVANWQSGKGAAARKVALSGGLYNWRGDRVVGVDESLDLQPGASRVVEIAKSAPVGAYGVRVELKEGDRLVSRIDEDLIVVAPQSVLGPQWGEDLKDVYKLRGPLHDRFHLIRHDWDWTEFQPGNLQVESMLWVARRDAARGLDPHVLLGFTAYWASGPGYEDMQNDKLSERYDRTPGARWWGGTVDIFHAPERMDDWFNYTREVMRLAGPHVAGWILWDSPGSDPAESSLGLDPARFAEMIETADFWRDRYCPETPIILGGLNRKSAPRYLYRLAESNALQYVDGVNLRIDAGSVSPEDGRIPDYVSSVRRLVDRDGGPAKRIVVTDLDWTVSGSDEGIDAFEQAAYLVRATLLLHHVGAEHALTIENEDQRRTGFGMAYKTSTSIPPYEEKLAAYQLKPNWLAMARARKLLSEVGSVAEVEVQGVIPGRTRCLLYKRKADGKSVAVVWRNDEPGELSFASTGCTVESAEDMFGSPVSAVDGRYPIGMMPTVFVLKAGGEPPAQALGRMRVNNTGQPLAWPEAVIATVGVATGGPHKYSQEGGTATNLSGRTATGEFVSWAGLAFAPDGLERFTVSVVPDAGLVLRKRFAIGADGHDVCEVRVNGAELGEWSLRRSDETSKDKLTAGPRESAFVVPAAALKGAKAAEIEVRYRSPGTSAGWVALEYRGDPLPLSAVGALHADSKVSKPRLARNIVGLPMRVGRKAYDNGVGVFAKNLLEYSLNGQFNRFTAEVGIDAITEGKGSVVFEVVADGKKLWSSKIMSGLDQPEKVDVDVKGVERLRLLVNDGGDGTFMDAANWCEPLLYVK